MRVGLAAIDRALGRYQAAHRVTEWALVSNVTDVEKCHNETDWAEVYDSGLARSPPGHFTSRPALRAGADPAGPSSPRLDQLTTDNVQYVN